MGQFDKIEKAASRVNMWTALGQRAWSLFGMLSATGKITAILLPFAAVAWSIAMHILSAIPVWASILAGLSATWLCLLCVKAVVDIGRPRMDGPRVAPVSVDSQIQSFADTVPLPELDAPVSVTATRTFIPLSAADLVRPYKDKTDVQAGRENTIYMMNWLRLCGQISTVSALSTGRTLVFMDALESDREPYLRTRIVLYFGSKWADQLHPLERGREVDVTGKLTEASASSITLDECEINEIRQPAPQPTPSPPAERLFVDVPTEELMRPFGELTTIQAQKQSKAHISKWLRTHGRVVNVHESYDGGCTVTISTADAEGFGNVRLEFDKDAANSLQALQRGAELSAVGMICSIDALGVNLEHCELEAIGAPLQSSDSGVRNADRSPPEGNGQ